MSSKPAGKLSVLVGCFVILVILCFESDGEGEVYSLVHGQAAFGPELIELID